MPSKKLFQCLAVFFAAIALMAAPLVLMGEGPQLRELCWYLQVFWLVSLSCVMVVVYIDRQDYRRVQVVPRIQKIQLV